MSTYDAYDVEVMLLLAAERDQLRAELAKARELLDATQFAMSENRNAGTAAPEPVRPAADLAPYDAGLLSDHGGGDVGWWQDYIRSLLGSAHDHYVAQVGDPEPVRVEMPPWFQFGTIKLCEFDAACAAIRKAGCIPVWNGNEIK